MLDVNKNEPIVNRDLKVLTLLITGIMVFEIAPAFVGAGFVITSISWALLTSPSYTNSVNRIAVETEKQLEPVTTSDKWSIIQPALYIGFVLFITFLALL